MEYIKLIGVGATLTMIGLLSGCTSFDPNNRAINFSGGKPYRVPYNTGMINVDKRMLSELRANGYTGCKLGNKMWIEKSYWKNYIIPSMVKPSQSNSVSPISQPKVLEHNPFKAKYYALYTGNLQRKLTNNEINIIRGYNGYPYYYGIQTRKAGCVSALNNQEYQYRLNQQNQQAENSRASDLSNAIMMPKTHNVNYTGTVYHY